MATGGGYAEIGGRANVVLIGPTYQDAVFKPTGWSARATAAENYDTYIRVFAVCVPA